VNRVLVERLDDSGASAAAWNAYVESHADSTIYHLFAWRRIFERSFGYRSWLLVARDESNGTLCGGLPLYLVKSFFGRRLVSVPFRDRGGLLWNTSEAFQALMAEARKVALEANASSVTLKTITPYPQTLAESALLQEHRHWIHSAVDLRGLTADILWQRIGDKNRNMVRQAQRSGLTCALLPREASSIRRWYELHVATQKRLGVPPFPLSYFTHLSAELEAHQMAIFGVSADEKLVAATILLLHGKTAIYGYSASGSGGQQRRTNDLMLHTVMLWLIQRDYRCFDMGSDSPRQESLLFFKRKWLSAQRPIPYYYWGVSTPPTVDSSDHAYRLARALFSRLPTPVLKIVGSKITRFFG